MFHDDEEKIMVAPGVCSDGSSCRHTFAPSVRVKTPSSHVKHIRWLHVKLLVILLAGQAACNEVFGTSSSLPATTKTQTSVYYSVSVTVDVSRGTKNESEIKAWLIQVFQNNLDSCGSPTSAETTAPPTSPQTTATTLQSFNTTTITTSTPLKSNSTNADAATSTTSNSPNTTTAATSTTSASPNTTTATSTTSNSPNTTTATSTTSNSPNTTTATSTMSNSPNTTTATSTMSNSPSTTTAPTSTTSNSPSTTTAPTSTTSNSPSTTTAASSTTSNSPGTTTAPTSTTSNSPSTTTAASSTTSNSPSTSSTSSSPNSNNGGGKPKPTNKPNSNSNSNRKLVKREIHAILTETSGATIDKTTGLFKSLEMSCNTKTNIKQTNCFLRLELKQSVFSSCCILRKLCTASITSADINVVGKKADRISDLNECNSNLQDSCIYNGPTTECDPLETAYEVPQLNSTQCSADNNNNCSCSASCNGADAYYTFKISIKDPMIENSDITTLILKQIQHSLNCSPSADFSCPLSTVASKFKSAIVFCESTGTTCNGILMFANGVFICDVSRAVMNAFQSETKIVYDGLVTRAAICGSSATSMTSLDSQSKWVKVGKKPVDFCETVEESNINCQNGKKVVALLDEQCNLFTTPQPNVTTAQPNANLTQNATTTAVNVTVTATVNTTSTNVSVTPSATPATNESADSQANALLELTRDVSQLNSSQVAQLISQLENLLSGPNVSLTLGNISVHIVSNLLGASPETLSDSSNRIIGIVDTVALKLVLEQQPETLLSPAVALSVKPADGSNFKETVFSISDATDVQVRGDPRHRRSARRESTIPQGSIKLPPSLTQDLTSEEQQQASRVQFSFYQKSTVFQDKSLGDRKLNSGILGASVANLSIRGLQDDIVIHLRNIEPIPANFVASCVFWDFTANNNSGGWNSSGCVVRNSTDNETVCSCNHLTSFAILLDLARQPLTSRLQDTILTFITYIGCGVSAIFLSMTLLTYLAFGKLRKDIPSKILIQLCLALLLLNLVFLVDAWLALYPDAVGLCISTAWFLHYFLLVAFTWMGLEAIHMYLALVKVFNSYISHYMVKFSLVGWGVPMIVVIIVIAIDKDNYGLVSYGKFPDGTTDDFCWLKNDIAFYVAVVAYFCVIFVFNFIMFIVVLVQLCRLKRQNPHNALHRTTLQDARSVVGITMLLGLTWGFAFFAWGPVNLAFMYLFAIFNSFQGLFIFVFHCALKENVRRQWRTYLCCGRMRLAENSEWSRTATQKTVKKSSVTRLTSLHSSKSSKSNNSSSSSSFLVNDASEQINGIGNPIDDRTITADEDPSMDVILNEINSQYRNQQAP